MEIIRFPQLEKKVQLSRTQVWRLEKEGGFPKRIQLTKNSVGWDQDEVETWLEQRKEASNA